MLSTKALGLRRPSIFSHPILDTVMRPSILLQTQWALRWRTLSTSPLRYNKNIKQALSPLEKQRLQRPVSPHLTIYKWEYQSLTSILQRFSGMFLSGSLYLFACGYLLAPLIIEGGSSHVFDITSIATAFGALPAAAKIGAKFVVAWPFTYHFFNGMKHLVWDNVWALKNKTVIRNCARAVAGCSFVSALVLAVL